MSKISDGLKTPSVAPRVYTEDRGLDRVGQRHLKPLCPSVSLLERGQEHTSRLMKQHVRSQA